MSTISQYSCDTCGGLGIVFARQIDKTVPCPDLTCEAGHERRRLVYERRFKLAGMPPLYAQMTFETWKAYLGPGDWEGKMLAWGAAHFFADRRAGYFSLQEIAGELGLQADRYLPQERNMLILTGPVGVGKTGLAASIANQLIAEGMAVLYIRVQDLLFTIQSTYGHGNNGDTEATIYSIKTAPMLILDEFNLENYTNDRLELMEGIIRSRHGNQLPLLVTTNLDMDECRHCWGDRITDILRLGHWITMSGTKLRNTVEGAVGDIKRIENDPEGQN